MSGDPQEPGLEGGTRSRGTRRIEFLEVLGRGGFGAVYLADVHGDNDFVQRLAIKVLSVEMSAIDDVAARQRDEARLLAQLNHDHILKVHDLTELHGRPAVLMEYIEGVDASEFVKHHPLSPRAALQLVAATASALHAAWTTVSPRTGQPLRVIHRDIKPENLLISRQGGVKVLDFGIARGDFAREGRTSAVQYGTARFMAPEQWLYGQASHTVDTYALGITLAELLAGALLDRAPLAPEAFTAHVDAVVGHILDPDWPAAWSGELEALLRGMICLEPEERLTAAEVQERALDLIEDAPGSSLSRIARRIVPELLEARRLRYGRDPVLDPLSLAMGTVAPSPVPPSPVPLGPTSANTIDVPAPVEDAVLAAATAQVPQAAPGPEGRAAELSRRGLPLVGLAAAGVGLLAVLLVGTVALVGLERLAAPEEVAELPEPAEDEATAAAGPELPAPDEAGSPGSPEGTTLLVEADPSPATFTPALATSTPSRPSSSTSRAPSSRPSTQAPSTTSAGSQGSGATEATAEPEEPATAPATGSASKEPAARESAATARPPSGEAAEAAEAAAEAPAAAPTRELRITASTMGARYTVLGAGPGGSNLQGSVPTAAPIKVPEGTTTVRFNHGERDITCTLSRIGGVSRVHWQIQENQCVYF